MEAWAAPGCFCHPDCSHRPFLGCRSSRYIHQSPPVAGPVVGLTWPVAWPMLWTLPRGHVLVKGTDGTEASMWSTRGQEDGTGLLFCVTLLKKVQMITD